MSLDLATRDHAQVWPGIGMIVRWPKPDTDREWAWLPITTGATFALTPQTPPRYRIGLAYRHDYAGD